MFKAIFDHYMLVVMGHCHSGPLDVSNKVKLEFLNTRCQCWESPVDLLAELGIDLPIAFCVQ